MTFRALKNKLLVLFSKKPEHMDSEEMFAAVQSLIMDLRAEGYEASAASLQAGFSRLNGLTDGWAAFLEQLEKARKELPPQASAAWKAELRKLIAAARYAVYHPRG